VLSGAQGSREFTRPIIIRKKYNQYSFLALPLTTAPKPNPYRLPIGIVDGRQAFAMLSQLRNIDSKRLVKKIIHLDADILAAIKKEASRVNFGEPLPHSFAPRSQGKPFGRLYEESYTSIMRMQGSPSPARKQWRAT
jgi:mRNA-degrading endonuclease toxin of MazEF toxin-antitoxin module